MPECSGPSSCPNSHQAVFLSLAMFRDLRQLCIQASLAGLSHNLSGKQLVLQVNRAILS